MNELIVSKNESTMSTIEIAELTGKRHDHVLRDTRNMLIELYAEGVTNFGDTYIHPQNNEEYKIYRLPKREALILTTGYSIIQRAAIIDRWQELEAKQSPALPNYQEALRQLADQLDISSKQQLIIEQQRPAVEFHASITDSSNAQTVEVIAKVLGTGQNRMFAWLRNEGLLKPDNLPYQHFLEMKLFRVIESSYLDKRGKSHTYTQTLVTGKGLEYIQKRFN